MNTILGIAAACFCVAAVLAIAASFSVCRKLRLRMSNQLEQAQRKVVSRLSDLDGKLNEVNQRLDAVGNRLSDLYRELNGISTAVIPDDSAARRAKAEVDKFNEGLYNIMTYNGSHKPEDK